MKGARDISLATLDRIARLQPHIPGVYGVRTSQRLGLVCLPILGLGVVCIRSETPMSPAPLSAYEMRL